jgi:glutamine amidotransferase
MIVVIDYGMGNTASIANMIKHIGGEAIVSSEISAVEKAKNLILPGVGAFDNAVRKLQSSGLYAIIEQKVREGMGSLLGICLGMQLLFDASEEGLLPGFGFIPGTVKRFLFEERNKKLKVPHMGWNDTYSKRENDLFSKLETPRFYFVHSYHPVPVNKDHILAMCNYGYPFVCAVQSKKVIGVQFHPEKSHRFGMQFFRNYLDFVC